MADLLFLAVLLGFFGACVIFVRLCDRMVESSDAGVQGSGTGDADDGGEPVAAEVAA